jgi:hypothetical protein
MRWFVMMISKQIVAIAVSIRLIQSIQSSILLVIAGWNQSECRIIGIIQIVIVGSSNAYVATSEFSILCYVSETHIKWCLT